MSIQEQCHQKVINEVFDKTLPIGWCAELSDGSRWFDQNRPDEKAEWLILKKFIESQSELKIKRVFLFASHNFRSEEDFDGAVTDSDCEGYFFAKKAICPFGSKATYHGYGVGFLKDNKIEILWYTPTMECIEREYRDPDQAPITLIRNN